MNSKDCLNCDLQLTDNEKFCPNCGQPTKLHRFTLSHFFHESFHAFTHADKGIFYLLKELAVRPGKVAQEYIGGKRKKYFNPFTFFLMLAAFYVLSSSFRATSDVPERAVPKGISTIKNPQSKKEALAIYQRATAARSFFTKHGNIVAMIAVPFFAFFFWLIYFRRAYNYAEHLVANLMFVSFANLAFSLIVFPLQAMSKGVLNAGLINLLGLVLQWFYFSFAYSGFMNVKGFSQYLKVFLATLIVLILWSVLTILSIAVYSYQSWNFLDLLKHLGK